MKKIRIYIGVAALGAALLSFPGCSDVYDDHYAAEDGNIAAGKTLWDLISEDASLSRFKAIAEKASYYRDETHPQQDYTFKDLLQNSIVTVWAPENDAFTEESYQRWLAMAEAKGSQGYTVQQQLMGNSIALWRQIATGGGIDTLTMLNGKKLEFDKNSFTMQGLKLDKVNLAGANGTLHTLKDTIPFRYNIYEYLKDAANTTENSLNRLHEYVVERDTTRFNENGSIEGPPDINGNPTYIDSVYYTTNLLFDRTHRFPAEKNTDQYLTYDESFGARIQVEDSAWVMVMPTDAALEEAYAKLEPLYNYATVYVNKEKNDPTSNTQIYIPRDHNNVKLNTDSLKEKNINMDILSPICFNLHTQPNSAGQKGRWTMEDFLAEKGASAQYFLNTFGDTLRSDDTWDKTSLFTGTQVELSNGTGFVADRWNFPRKLYNPDIYVDINYNNLFSSPQNTNGPENKAFSNDNAGDWIDTLGRVANDNFYIVETSGTSLSPKVEFKLIGTDGENFHSSLYQNCEVMSGTYDIYVVMVPDFYRDSGSNIVFNVGTTAAIVDGDTIPVKHKIQAIMSYCNNTNGKDVTITSEYIVYEGQKVDTLLLFKDFKFPYSYKNLRQTYPTIQMSSRSTASERGKGFNNNFCIDQFILRSKDE